MRLALPRSNGVNGTDEWGEAMKKDLPSYHLKMRPSEVRRRIVTRLASLGIDGNPDDYATPESVLAHVGDKPESTDLRDPFLSIKDGELPFTENFYWRWYIRTDVFDDIMSHDVKRNRVWLSTRLASMTDDEIRHARQYGLRLDKKKNDYRQHVGRVFGSLKVIYVSEKESNGIVYYIYTVKCTRCGAIQTRRASLFIKGRSTCKRCGYKATRKNKNSAVVYSNRWGRYVPKWKSVVDPGLGARLLMNNFMGEFTIFHGQPGYMEARIDADLLGITED